MTDNDRTAQLERACSYLRRIPAWYLATTMWPTGISLA